MKILVLGGTRYMGKHLVKELLASGHYVTIATRGTTTDDFGSQVNRLIADRSNRDSLIKNIPGQTYDVVIDSLAYCSNDVKYLMESVKCKRYIQISSASVYTDWHNGITEGEFDAHKKTVVYCGKNEFTYGELKRQAECAIVQGYPHIACVRIRFPFVIGPDDYTKRLYFYIEHVVNQQPMFIDNRNARMAFVRSDEAGKFIAFFVGNNYVGAINGASPEMVSVDDILNYVKLRVGKEPVLANDGEPAPYNGVPDYYLDTGKAESIGFSFEPLKNWIYELIDYYIASCHTGHSCSKI